jgi:dipeptidase E
MSLNRILAISSSRVADAGYLQNAEPLIHHFLGESHLTIAFIPFALVTGDYEGYTSLVKKALQGLPYSIETVQPDRAKEILGQADVMMVGGGNTFKLLHDIYELKLLDIIRDKVNKGVPYIGWSAGSNILGPTIGTTNDMPVIAPKSLNALGLLPFQINPHYNNFLPAGHQGETRDQRLQEFVNLNPGVPIIGLPEGTALMLDQNKLQYIGPLPGFLFSSEEEGSGMIKKEINAGDDLSFLL